MNNLKEQILNLFQNWYDKYASDTWHSYKEEIRRLTELLEQIYTLVKNYDEPLDSALKRIKEGKGLAPIYDNENYIPGITYMGEEIK
jgi:hypothetical protein